MAYSELIKNFERIRSYMREFYVYGFRSRSEYDGRSTRSYDNERRRIESWLGDYLTFRRDASGKNVFLSVDSRQIPRNPLYKAFRAKSFTERDISERRGREVLYRRTDQSFALDTWTDALAYFTEENPLGVVGSYLEDRLAEPSDVFRFKHHYILHALDSEILCRLLEAIDQRRAVELHHRNLRSGRDYQRTVCPLNIYVSTQTGRQYLLGYQYCGRLFRLDAIQRAVLGNVERRYDTYAAYQRKLDTCLWGVSTGPDYNLDHVEMTLRLGPGEAFILQRLEREKRHGVVERLDETTCRYTAHCTVSP